MKLTTFFLLNFIVSFISDIVLNDLSNEKYFYIHKSKIIASLKPYFKIKSIIQSGIYAALTIVISLAFVSAFSKIFFGFLFPKSNIELVYFVVIAFFLGYLIDILIDKTNLFGDSIKPYYKEAGSGLWGAIAFIFSITISYFIQKNIIPHL